MRWIEEDMDSMSASLPHLVAGFMPNLTISRMGAIVFRPRAIELAAMSGMSNVKALCMLSSK
jgi:hypothetical protein